LFRLFRGDSRRSPGGIDAVQFEFGSRYRRKAVQDQSARDAARAITAFHEAYLKTAASR
jgi:hypothetical protein